MSTLNDASCEYCRHHIECIAQLPNANVAVNTRKEKYEKHPGETHERVYTENKAALSGCAECLPL